MSPRQWPHDDISEGMVLVPDGAYALQIVEAIETETAGGEGSVLPAGCLMYRAQYSIAEPEPYVGYPQYDYFVIGTTDDPQADDPETWKASIGARQLKRMFKAAQVPMSDDIDEMCAMAVGQQLIGVVGQQVTKRGTPMNQINGYYALGEREVGLEHKPAAARGRVPARAPAAAPRAATPPAAPPQRPAPAARVVPGRPAAPPPPPANPKKGGAAGAMTKCAVCGDSVPRAQFAQHVQAHGGGEE